MTGPIEMAVLPMTESRVIAALVELGGRSAVPIQPLRRGMRVNM